MSYDLIEVSVQESEPVFLVLFVRGGLTWRFTNIGHDFNAQSETWLKSPIKVGEIKQTAEILKSVVKLEFPMEDDFALQYIGSVPEQKTSVTIFRGNKGDTSLEWNLEWKGRIASTKPNNNKLILSCEPISASLGRSGLYLVFQRSCRHTVYGRGCGLNKADWLVSGNVESLNGVTVVIPEAEALGDGYLTGGFLEMASGDARFIIDHVGDTVALIRPMLLLEQALIDAGTDIPINLYPGCDYSRKWCAEFFDNLLNHGGFLIPKRNPMDGLSIV